MCNNIYGCYQIFPSGVWIAHNWQSINGGPWYCTRCGLVLTENTVFHAYYAPQDPKVTELEEKVKKLEERIAALEAPEGVQK